MAQDLSGNPPPLVRAASPAPKYLMLGGVIGACALGVAAGMWARPVDDERPGFVATRPEPAAPGVTRQLQIVVDDGPAPLGDPLEVLSEDMLRHVEPRFVLPAPSAAAAAPSGLMRVTATAPVEANALPASAPIAMDKPVIAKSASAPVIALTPRKAIAKTEPVKAGPKAPAPIRTAKVETPKPKTEVVLAKAKAEKPAKKIELAKAKSRTEKATKTEVAKAEPKRKLAETTAKASKLAKAEAQKAVKLAKAAETKAAKALAQKARAAKARTDEAVKLAKVAEQRRLVANEKAATARRAQMKIAKAQEERTRAAGLQAAKAKAAKAQRAAGLRMASAPRCASADPLVCGASTTADRRMTAAYRQAEAAGVPQTELRRQHERWLSARAAAAREAPWAVPDVYQERIAELRDQARYAQDGY